MITAPTSCYYIVKITGEAAQQVISEISPSTGRDIETALLVSMDFENDVYACNQLAQSINHITSKNLGRSISTTEVNNPLYYPGSVESLDEMLNVDARGDSVGFIGMNNNPYILKTIDIHDDEISLVSAKIEYRPFDLPGYNDLMQTRQYGTSRLN